MLLGFRRQGKLFCGLSYRILDTLVQDLDNIVSKSQLNTTHTKIVQVGKLALLGFPVLDILDVPFKSK